MDDLADRLGRVLAQRSEVVFAYLFGSQAAGATHKRSDVDVAVWLEEPYDRTSPALVGSLVSALTGALGRRDIDIVILNEAPLRLAFAIVHGKLLLDRDEEERVTIEAAIKSRYHDRLHYHRRHVAHEGRQLAERGFS